MSFWLSEDMQPLTDYVKPALKKAYALDYFRLTIYIASLQQTNYRYISHVSLTHARFVSCFANKWTRILSAFMKCPYLAVCMAGNSRNNDPPPTRTSTENGAREAVGIIRY